MFEKIVLVERLREVRALVGFTRIESPGDYDTPVSGARRSAGSAVPQSADLGAGLGDSR